MTDAIVHPELSNTTQTSPERHSGNAGPVHNRADAAGPPQAVEAGFKPLAVDALRQRRDLTALPELLNSAQLAHTLYVADRSYHADDVRSNLLLHGELPVVPARRHRRKSLSHDERFYRLRSRVERLVTKPKQFRRIATRYNQTTTSFLSFSVADRLLIVACAMLNHGTLFNPEAARRIPFTS
jgi:transposase